MSSQSKKMMEPCFVVLGQLLLLWIVMVQGQNSTERTDTTSVTNPTGPNIAAIVAPTVILGLLAIAAVVLLLFFCVIRKKRQTEGTYRPSAEEQTGARGVQAPDALKLPKEERLI
ncbi:protein crumbs homolog 3a [Scleropages formosus]|nr:protein crumbs homolog 3 [Scleropages formosus]